MGLFVLIIALEVAPAVTFTRWRMASGRGVPIDTSRARTFARTSMVQVFLVVLMVFAATAMARGIGY
jgi:putative membrane protein